MLSTSPFPRRRCRRSGATQASQWNPDGLRSGATGRTALDPSYPRARENWGPVGHALPIRLDDQSLGPSSTSRTFISSAWLLNGL